MSNSSNADLYQQQQAQQLPPDQQDPNNRLHPLANYQFSPQEARALKECDIEALTQRSIPLGTAFGVASYMLVKKGYLKPSVKYGPTPKVVLGVIVGYFLGKFSYQNKCAEKIMRIPDSKLGEMLKMRRRGGRFENLTPDAGFGSGLALAPFSSATDQYSDEFQKSTTLNLDTERPTMSGLDDTYRPNVDAANTVQDDDLPLVPPKQQTSYDELRQQNREDYAKKHQNPYYRPIQQEVPPIIRAPRPPQQGEHDDNVPKGPKNKYGDIWSQ